jgi:hypothetical protein
MAVLPLIYLAVLAYNQPFSPWIEAQLWSIKASD